MKIEALYEDDFILLVNKPNNLLVHPSAYSGGRTEPTLIHYLWKQFDRNLVTLHRLDRKTSGVMIFAKDAESARFIRLQFENNEIKKEYLAVLRGYTSAKGEIDSPIKRADTGEYKEALTSFETLDQIELPFPIQPYSTARYSFVKMSPHTGRMHQLRKHANKISHPIIGDPKYGNRHHNHYFNDELGFGNLFLHAHQLSFIHPSTKQPMHILADIPDFWKMFFDVVNWSVEQLIEKK
ncbi:MAG: pseudouridine synthase [Flavobacteriales bacterium]|nr:pseudouridine synthase [Flavobacteriales bacterium]